MPIHPSSIVDSDASVSDEATIWHFSHVSGGAQVARLVMIGQSVFVGRNVRIGARTRVQNFSNLVEGVVLEEDVFIGPHVTFTNVKYPRVGYPARGRYAETLVERGATIGANATILPGLVLGHHSFVGAGAVVTKNVLPYALVQGNPAQRVGWVSEAGVKLVREGGALVCPKTGRRYGEGPGGLEELREP